MAAPGLLAHRQAAELESRAQSAAAEVFLAKELESCEASAEKGHMICKVLDFLMFVCSFELKAIVCKEHGILLPLDGIKPHLRKHNWGFWDSRLPLDKVVEHICNFHCHNISTSFDPPLFPLMLSAPFEINSDRRTIRFRYQCPQPQCNLWITRNDTYAGCPETELYNHLSDHGQKKHPRYPKGSWCQTLNNYKPVQVTQESTKRHTFQLLNYEPTERTISPSFATRASHAPSTSTWFHELKWAKFRQTLQAQDIPWERLERLVRPPSQQAVFCANNTVTRHIEEGLLLVRKELSKYLKNGQKFISSLHGSYRRSLRPKYGLIS